MVVRSEEIEGERRRGVERRVMVCVVRHAANRMPGLDGEKRRRAGCFFGQNKAVRPGRNNRELTVPSVAQRSRMSRLGHTCRL